MNVPQIVFSILFLFLSIGFFVLSVFQFRGRGFLFNNAYILASHKEREKMDSNKESKRPHYRQSGFVFLLLGISFLLLAAYMAVHWKWLLAAYWATVMVTVLYAAASSIKNEIHK